MEQVYELQKMKVTSSSQIFKTTCHNGSYLLLFRKRYLLLLNMRVPLLSTAL